MTEQQTTKAKKGAKKSFFELKAPLTTSKIHLYGTSEADFNGKIVKVDLTRVLKGKNFELRLRVNSSEGKIDAVPVGLELLGSFIRRMMRTGIDYVEDSFEAETKDAKVRVKPFLITRNKVSRSVRNELRKTARAFVESYVKARTTLECFADITANKVQKELFMRLKKIYPLALCEIRIFEVIETKK